MPGNTSTDAEELMAAGSAATLSFSIPVRNMHSAFEVTQPDDAEAGALLAAAVTRKVAEGGWDAGRFIPGSDRGGGEGQAPGEGAGVAANWAPIQSISAGATRLQ